MTVADEGMPSWSGQRGLEDYLRFSYTMNLARRLVKTVAPVGVREHCTPALLVIGSRPYCCAALNLDFVMMHIVPSRMLLFI